MSNFLISLKKVSRSYDKERIVALKDITLDIHTGEFISIVGPSGSGKSTLLHLISGLDLPTRGKVCFEGRSPRSANQWREIRARRIGLIFQAFLLLPTLTVLENVEVPMFGIIAHAKQRKERAIKLVAQVGLKDRGNHYPNELSGGERQRVAIARAMSNSPDLLLADEPTGNLDSVTSADIIDLLMDFYKKNDRTLVIVTHEERIARQGDKIIRMLDGRITS